MKRVLSLLCVTICLLGVLGLSGCDPMADEKAKQIKQSGIDIFAPDNYDHGCKSVYGGIKSYDIGGASLTDFMKDPCGTPLCSSENLHCLASQLDENSADSVLLDLLDNAIIYDRRYRDLPTERMPDLEPNGARPTMFSGNTEWHRDVTEILFCEGIPNIGDYLFSQRPELTRVYLPDSVTEIGEHAFAEGCQTVIYCHRGSCAEQYAKNHGMNYQII